MAKYDSSTTPERPPATRPLDADSQALVAALAAAILSSRRDERPPSRESSDAAAEYAEIKAALRTHAERRPGHYTQQS